jgi:type VI secretion system protein VasD
MKRTKIWWWGLVCTALTLTACSTAVKVTLKAGDTLNSDTSTTPLPVVVRVYQLNDDVAFKNADFRDLWKKDKEVLGQSLVVSREIVMSPKTKERVEFPYNENARYVGAVAIFRNPSISQWRVLDSYSNNFFTRFWNKTFGVSVDVRLTQNRIELD